VQKSALTVCVLFILLGGRSLAQLPAFQWSLHYGGSTVDIPYVIKFTSGNGTIVAGYTDSKDGQPGMHNSRDYWALWVVKLNNCGDIEWQRSVGGTGYETAKDIAQTSDGGYIVLGETNSTDGDVVSGHGGTKDIWLLKLSATGNIQWQKRYGGSGFDVGNHIEIMSDGSYLIAGTTSSNDGDINGNHSTGTFTDAVLMKIASSGAMQWSKCFGGSKNDELLDCRIINGKIYAAGYANSIDGDIPPSQKNYDAWLLALDADGNKIFSKVYGGSQNDVAYAMTIGNDNSLTLAGYTTSNDGDVSGAKGSQDFWALNINLDGKLNWQRVAGGTDAEYANTIITDKDGGYLLGGLSYSNDGDITAAKGEGDYWVVKLDAAGKMVWQRSFGGSGNDNLHSLILNAAGNEFYLAGDSDSGDGDFSNSMGDVDFGIIKLKDPLLQTKDTTVCSLNGFIAATDTLKDICGYDSLLVNYHATVLSGPFVNINKSDTIFAGQSFTLPYNGNGQPLWDSHQPMSCTDCANPVVSPLVTTSYTATSTLSSGCSVSDQFTVVVLNDALVLTPSAFTPNNDGKNDYFGPLGKAPDGYVMQIFNRYGQRVFTSSSMNTKWDGTVRGEPQPAGVYVYIITYPDLQKQLRQQKGTITLIR